MINLAEEALDYIGACGYGVEDIKVVRARGINDGVLYGVEPEAFLDEARNIEYNEQDDGKMHISKDLCILMKDGSAFCREWNPVDRFEWFKWHSESDASWQDRSDLVLVQPDEVEISLD